nr:hypothetical protein BaRGS_008858 [Batillaria attramentaria]
MSSDRVTSGLRSGSRTPPGSGHSSARSSGCKSGPTTPVSKPSQGLPLLPPPPYCSRPTSSQRKATSVPSTPEKKFPPEMFTTAAPPPSPAHHPDVSRGSSHSAGSGAMRHSDSSESSWNTAHSGSSGQRGSINDPARREGVRRSSQGDSSGAAGSPAPTGHVTGKPPIGNSAHGRAVVAPPYGKLVERLQTGEWRKNQARSLVLPSDSLQLQVAPTFGNATGDVSTGRRPLSLV